ncbi:3-oxo-5-alpha-steroid 4-dehydrogenase [Eremomyces bilateralis CBS 781.70]|uniref:3-oxo-5-alpha-steroid 4-dehydrogenase n=1 Tax=Eremomyces bilateralis CBS 781.70 TaxID=1392243 RepID=A0A6G1FWF6_9PEZI|nr:3-oxo-5-alpha-steroid 4-dehydrogenase [Eremomyces bilateralis CBS 781.70]KAF1810032.1 3-oxo-5-alpha-steroid 4-dehydrogenase [Eremomyces bilateralis CBS 781.70]
MSLIQGWLPPSRQNWELIVNLFSYVFPLFTCLQWLTDWYPMGKTSITSRFNIPGKVAWTLMEVPGFSTLVYIMFALPKQLGIGALPWGNWLMTGLFVTHYVYRALLAPLVLNPSMSPIHPLVAFFAAGFQMANALSIGGWLAGYGPTDAGYWDGRTLQVGVGTVIWAAGLIGNIYHDDVLRDIRRVAMRKKEDDKARGKASDSSKVYQVPEKGLFRYVLYAHYLCEWIEWTGYWVMGGVGCIPARTFVINEITTMLPRATSGKRWYIAKFGKEKIGGRKAAIPGLI